MYKMLPFYYSVKIRINSFVWNGFNRNIFKMDLWGAYIGLFHLSEIYFQK